jgi:hypothetical protein
MTDIATAIQSLNKKGGNSHEFVVRGEQTAYDNNQYQRDRASAYPSIQDQLDMQYHDAVDGTTTWKDAVAAVKTAHPKP